MNRSVSDQLAPNKKTAQLHIIPFVAVVLLLLLAFAMYSQSLEKKSNLPQGLSFGCQSEGAAFVQPVLILFSRLRFRRPYQRRLLHVFRRAKSGVWLGQPIPDVIVG